MWESHWKGEKAEPRETKIAKSKEAKGKWKARRVA